MTKLSPAMKAAMWQYIELESGHRRSISVNARTEKALIARGLVERWGINGRFVNATTAGRAWLEEQYEQAHADALDEQLDRAHGAFMAEPPLSPCSGELMAAADAADRAVVRANPEMAITAAWYREVDHDYAMTAI